MDAHPHSAPSPHPSQARLDAPPPGAQPPPPEGGCPGQECREGWNWGRTPVPESPALKKMRTASFPTPTGEAETSGLLRVHYNFLLRPSPGLGGLDTGQGVAHLLLCACVHVGGTGGAESWYGESRTALRGWHGVCGCAMPRTAQGLDGTPAEFESQLDPATEEQWARPCPVSGVVEDEGSCRAGGPWRRGENMPLNLNSPKGRWGRWDHRAEEFLQGWNSW